MENPSIQKKKKKKKAAKVVINGVNFCSLLKVVIKAR